MKGPNIISHGDKEFIKCRGEVLCSDPGGFTKLRARKVAKWILANAVSTISGPTEERLRVFLHEHDRDLTPGILQTLREFNHRVPV